jgi:UDP-glucose 4-epimerase
MVKLLYHMGGAWQPWVTFPVVIAMRCWVGDFVQGHFGDLAMLDAVFSDGFNAVMHVASFIQVGESVQQPDKYYRNNLS